MSNDAKNKKTETPALAKTKPSAVNVEKSKQVDDVLTRIEKAHGRGAIMRLGSDAAAEPIAVIPSGCLALDEALGIGGYPRGRIVEIYGPESSGKTTLTLHAISEVQKLGGVAAFIDAEHAFDVRYAKAIGVDISQLLVSQPDSGEQALEIADTLAKSGAVDLVVNDSVAALVPKAELEGEIGAIHVGLQARLMGQAVRKLTNSAEKSKATLIFINQLRQKVGVVFGNPETTPGGNALKFHASVRIDVRRIGKVTLGETVVGNRTRAKLIKNKCAAPFTEAEFDIRWGLGIDALGDLLDIAVACGVVDKSGSHLSFGGKAIGQGREKARDTLAANPELCAAIEHETRAALPSHALRLVAKKAA